jgi:methionyl-tRNA formyltransferase
MEKDNLNFVFFGTPEVASRTLKKLIESGYMPRAVVTNPDKPSGRGLVMTKSPVKILAEENNIKVFTPEKINEEFTKELDDNIKTDLFIVVAYGKILPEEFIKIPKLGTINIHYSLLPRWRGASPVEASLLASDEETGVSIQQMAYKMDTGPIITEEKIKINLDDTKEILRNELIDLGSRLLIETLPKIIEGEINLKIQDESLATYCKKIKKEDGEINLNDNARDNWNKYRAFFGWPGTYFFEEKNGKKIRMKIAKAIYENNSFIIKRVVPEGKNERDFI